MGTLRLIMIVLLAVTGVVQAAEPASEPTADEVRWRQLVTDYLAWKPQAIMDEANPYQSQIVAQGDRIVPLLLEKGGSPMDLGVIWILGEMGSRRAFDALLSEYVARPSPRTAISLGSCLGEPEVAHLFTTEALSDKQLRTLLADVYGEDWPAVKTRNTAELKADLLGRLESLRKANRQRSKPQLG